VLPLLEAVGYDRFDIQAKVPVTFVHGTKRGRSFEADFVAYSGALRNRDTSLLVVEVKTPGTPLDDAREQGESYAFVLRTPVLLVTDGLRLHIWQVQQTGESLLILDIPVSHPTEGS
jgi:Type I restriction enzyme R protein N terminus (HSDR_N)